MNNSLDNIKFSCVLSLFKKEKKDDIHKAEFLPFRFYLLSYFFHKEANI